MLIIDIDQDGKRNKRDVLTLILILTIVH